MSYIPGTGLISGETGGDLTTNVSITVDHDGIVQNKNDISVLKTEVQSLEDTVDGYTDASGNTIKGNTEKIGDLDTKIDNLTTNDIAESVNLYYTDTRFDNRLSTKSTTDVSEGNNLYYTDTRFDTRFNNKTTDNVTEGTNNLYYTDTRFDTRFNNKTTDDITEGTTNLYYTDARVENELNDNNVYFKVAVDDSGNNFKATGIGTSNPLKTLHVNGDILYTEEQYKLLDGVAYTLTDSIFDRRKLLLTSDDATSYYGTEKENHTDENGDYYTYEGSYSKVYSSSIVHYLPHIEDVSGVDYYKGQSSIKFKINDEYVPGIYASGANLNLGVINQNPLMNINQLGVDLYSVLHWKTEVDQTQIEYIDVDDGYGGTTQVPDPAYINTLKNANNLEASDFKEMLAFVKTDNTSRDNLSLDKLFQDRGNLLALLGAPDQHPQHEVQRERLASRITS